MGVCVCVCVCVCVGFVMCVCLYAGFLMCVSVSSQCVILFTVGFVLFCLRVFILICSVCTGVRTTATE